MIDALDPLPAARAPWLMTLADLALLLVGFLVLIEATRHDARGIVASGLRARFGGIAPAAAIPPPVAAGVARFAPGSAVPADDLDPLVDWARDAARDQRTVLTVTGATDGSAADRDAASGSAPLLAADRARAVAARLAPLVAPRRLVITTDPRPAQAATTVSVAFAGPPKELP